jgi:hypothetical protein
VPTEELLIFSNVSESSGLKALPFITQRSTSELKMSPQRISGLTGATAYPSNLENAKDRGAAASSHSQSIIFGPQITSAISLTWLGTASIPLSSRRFNRSHFISIPDAAALGSNCAGSREHRV